MAKKKERDIAKVLYLENGYTAKEIAERLQLSEKTVSRWVHDGQWRELRTSKQSKIEKRELNIIEIISDMAEERIRLQEQIMSEQKKTNPESVLIIDLRKKTAQIDDAISKWNKTLTTIKKDNEINQLTFMKVMEIIFSHFDKRHPELMKISTEFQDYLLQNVVELYGK